jgi:hypothetical protein
MGLDPGCEKKLIMKSRSIEGADFHHLPTDAVTFVGTTPKEWNDYRLHEAIEITPKGCYVFLQKHVIPLGFGLLCEIFYNPTIPAGLKMHLSIILHSIESA